MAYTDTRKPVDPVSFGAAVAINGGVIALALLAGVVITKERDIPIQIIAPPPPVITTTPPHAKAIEKPLKPKPAPQASLRSIDTPAPTTDNPSFGNTTGDADIIFLGTGNGEIAGPVIEPLKPLITPPVLVSAKRNPRYARQFQPDYPPAMIREGVEGSVGVRVLIGIDGRVKAFEVVSATRDDFADVTRRQAMNAWRFLPATEGGKPVESWQTLKVSFQLPE